MPRVTEPSSLREASMTEPTWDIQKDVEIDMLALDVAASTMADLLIAWGNKYVAARGEMDRLEHKADTILKQLEIDVRKDPETHGLDKGARGGAPPVEAVKAVAATHPRYLKAYKRYLRAKETSNLLGEAVSSLKSKDSNIKTLVTLQGQSYFAGPSVPRSLRDVYQAATKAREQRINTKGNRKRDLNHNKEK
jgi:hypothetical protein